MVIHFVSDAGNFCVWLKVIKRRIRLSSLFTIVNYFTIKEHLEKSIVNKEG